MAASDGVKELIWLKRLLDELTEENKMVKFLMDNQSAIRHIKNPEFHKRTKHIDVRYLFIRNENMKVNFLIWKQLAGIFTKALLWEKFETFKRMTGMI